MKKACFVTCARSEYGLLKWIMHDIEASGDVQLQIIVSGAHLSPEHGYTVTNITDDGFRIDKRVEMLLSSESAVGIAKSMGLVSIGISEAFEDLAPDIIVVLGDRYELLPICSTALVMDIPIAHISGGDITEGAIDNQVRNAVTMMATLHFPGNADSAERICRMIGAGGYVYNAGEPGLDSFTRTRLMDRAQLAESLHLDPKKDWVLLTLHPETKNTLEYNLAMAENVIKALEKLPDIQCVITQANADLGGSQINTFFREVCKKDTEKFSIYPSLGHVRYLSFMRQVKCVVGNSSSGIVEAPFLGKPVVNIGHRQTGRHICRTVRCANNEIGEISQALRQAIEMPAQCDNYYGNGNSSRFIADKIIEFLVK